MFRSSLCGCVQVVQHYLSSAMPVNCHLFCLAYYVHSATPGGGGRGDVAKKEGGGHPENVPMLCVVLLKPAFFLTFCVFRFYFKAL